MSTLSSNLWSMRETRGLSQAQAAKLIGVSQTGYSRWERTASPATPGPEHYEALAVFLGEDPAEVERMAAEARRERAAAVDPDVLAERLSALEARLERTHAELAEAKGSIETLSQMVTAFLQRH